MIASSLMASITFWSIFGGGVMLGAAVGAALAIVFLKRVRSGDAESTRELERKLETYRDDVASHYAETAKRVDALTHAYKDVYEHLEDGAYRLVGERQLRRRLDDARTEPVTLEGLGRKALRSGTGEGGTEAGDAPASANPKADDAR